MEQIFAKVKGEEGLEKDLLSGLVRAQPSAYQEYIERKNRRIHELSKDREIQDLRTRLERLESILLSKY